MTDQWTVDSSRIEKKLRKSRDNAGIQSGLYKFMEQLATLGSDGDPAILGTRKTGRYRGFIGVKLTKSERLIYKIDYKNKIVIIYGIGDHKDVYGRD